MAQMAVELRNVTKKRRTKTVGPLHLEVPEGYITALVGQNGSGKSTLLHMLLKLTHPDEGEIRWFGQSFEGELPLPVRQSIAYVAEHPIRQEDYWGPEEAAWFRSRWYPQWDQDYFEKLMNTFEVPRGQKLGKMSKGERRKFEIAAALAAGPKLLLLDEPSSGLDPFAWRAMIEILQNYMNERQAAILISTHIVEEVRRLADYITLLHQGRLLGTMEKDALLGAWSEVWISAHDEEELQGIAAELPDAFRPVMGAPGTASLLTSRLPDLEKRLADLNVKVFRSRSLDLEESLELWIKGYTPKDMDA